MSKPFDMKLFLAGVMTGSQATRQRHLRQAMIIQAAIADYWQLSTPWAWKRKHLIWFYDHCLKLHSDAAKYYYLLTIRLLISRLGKLWVLKP